MRGISVGEVVVYMESLRSGFRSGARCSMSRAISSVLKSYSAGDMAGDVTMVGFLSGRGSGVRSFLEFRMRYEELKEMELESGGAIGRKTESLEGGGNE
jgi:hypothetical protein